jgi:hypothetical protein
MTSILIELERLLRGYADRIVGWVGKLGLKSEDMLLLS